MRTLVALLSALAILVVLAGCKTSRKGYESAPYKVVSKDGKFEVRDYPALTVVETPMADNSGSSFNRLFRYISGGNADGEKIAMTTPVFMAGTDSQRSMSFVMPVDMKATPAPSDSSVSVATVPAGRFAVFGFSGSRSAQSEAEALTQLREWLDARKLNSSAQPIFGYFDPPWTPPFLRRNEVMLRLDAHASTK
jgi:DNA gyrase inhibitor GyrI